MEGEKRDRIGLIKKLCVLWNSQVRKLLKIKKARNCGKKTNKWEAIIMWNKYGIENYRYIPNFDNNTDT